MTEKQALLIACELFDEQIDEMEQYHDDEDFPDYYQKLKDAVEIIKRIYERTGT